MLQIGILVVFHCLQLNHHLDFMPFNKECRPLSYSGTVVDDLTQTNMYLPRRVVCESCVADILGLSRPLLFSSSETLEIENFQDRHTSTSNGNANYAHNR